MVNCGECAYKYHQAGFNCAQAVFVTFAEENGIEKTLAARLTNCLGGGFAGTGGVCGAVMAACLAVSAKFGRELPSREGEQMLLQDKNYRLVRKLQEDFYNEFGSVNCTDLLKSGLAASGEEENDKFLCPRYVVRAAEMADLARQES